jgi:DGQHR domain-containing protein
MNIPSNMLEQLTTEVLQRESQERQALSMLLDKYTGRKDKLFVQSAEMGGTQSYIGAVSLEWFAERVRFASTLPLFTEKVDPLTKKVIIDKDTVDEVLQRPIDYSRQAVLAQYLAARPMHKFPPVLVVVNQYWVDIPEADEWGSDGSALKSPADFTPLDSGGKFGILDISDAVQIYALDGQHRLLGVQGLMELIKHGKLAVKDKTGKPKASGDITIEDLEERFGIKNSDLQQLGKELIGIEFISAVVPGETRNEAKRRVRSIFVHVNKMASPLTAGQLHQLDDDNGFALVAKRIATTHPFFTGGDGKRVNWENNTISTRSLNFTTLQALTEMVRGLIGNSSGYKKWIPSERGLIPMRPEEAELESAIDLFSQYIDQVESLPSVKRYIQGTVVTILRNFESEIQDENGNNIGEGNLLFRPVGQTALAAAVGVLRDEGANLDAIFKKVSKYESHGGFTGMDKPSSIWYGVLFDPGKKRMSISGESLSTRLMIYLFGGGIADENLREQLRVDLVTAREVDGVFRKFDGTTTTNQADIFLPPPL